jgi:hypothetical protein
VQGGCSQLDLKIRMSGSLNHVLRGTPVTGCDSFLRNHPPLSRIRKICGTTPVQQGAESDLKAATLAEPLSKRRPL